MLKRLFSLVCIKTCMEYFDACRFQLFFGKEIVLVILWYFKYSYIYLGCIIAFIAQYFIILTDLFPLPLFMCLLLFNNAPNFRAISWRNMSNRERKWQERFVLLCIDECTG